MRIVYHLTLSAYSRKVRLVLAEKRLPFELRLEKAWERRTDYLDLNQARDVPTLLEANGLAVPGANVICQSLEEAYPDTPLLGTTLAERVEVRRLIAWFDGKFDAEVTQKLNGEKYYKRISGIGQPDAAALRAGYANLRAHMEHLGWMTEQRQWLAGPSISLADFTAAAHVSVLDFMGEIDWAKYAPAREWYARIKSRPSFRPLLAERVPGFTPPAHYADLDF